MGKSKCQTCKLNDIWYGSVFCKQCWKSMNKNEKPRIASQNFYDVM
jgi:hypothetical protein